MKADSAALFDQAGFRQSSALVAAAARGPATFVPSPNFTARLRPESKPADAGARSLALVASRADSAGLTFCENRKIAVRRFAKTTNTNKLFDSKFSATSIASIDKWEINMAVLDNFIAECNGDVGSLKVMFDYYAARVALADKFRKAVLTRDTDDLIDADTDEALKSAEKIAEALRLMSPTATEERCARAETLLAWTSFAAADGNFDSFLARASNANE